MKMKIEYVDKPDRIPIKLKQLNPGDVFSFEDIHSSPAASNLFMVTDEWSIISLPDAIIYPSAVLNKEAHIELRNVKLVVEES